MNDPEDGHINEEREISVNWEEVDRLTDSLPEMTALSWLRQLIVANEKELADCDVGVLSVYNVSTGRTALFRVGLRVPMLGLLRYAEMVVEDEVNGRDA